MSDTIERLDQMAQHLLTEHATLGRVIQSCRERQAEVIERLEHVELLIEKEREMRADLDLTATLTFTGQSDSQKTHAMAVSG